MPEPTVALFMFNRPDLAALALDGVRRARPRRLLLVADAPRPGHPADGPLCAASRALAATVDWPCELATDFSEVHLGPRRRFEVCFERFAREPGDVILVEDDIVVGPDFFDFCGELLDRYREEEAVLSVGGTASHLGIVPLVHSYAFSRYAQSGAWATWSRALRVYQPGRPRPAGFDSEEEWLAAELGSRDAGRYWAYLLSEREGHEVQWDYVWSRSSFLARGLHAVPARNLVTNLGHRPDATHSKEKSRYAERPVQAVAHPLVHPPAVERLPALDAFIEGDLFHGRLTDALEAVRNRMRIRRGPSRRTSR